MNITSYESVQAKVNLIKENLISGENFVLKTIPGVGSMMSIDMAADEMGLSCDNLDAGILQDHIVPSIKSHINHGTEILVIDEVDRIQKIEVLGDVLAMFETTEIKLILKIKSGANARNTHLYIPNYNSEVQSTIDKWIVDNSVKMVTFEQ